MEEIRAQVVERRIRYVEISVKLPTERSLAEEYGIASVTAPRDGDPARARRDHYSPRSRDVRAQA
jgi:hypothetical protein